MAEFQLRGRTKAAIILGTLPDELLRKVIKFLDKRHVEVLAQEYMIMPDYDQRTIDGVYKEFIDALDGQSFDHIKRGAKMARDVLTDFAGHGDVDEILTRISVNNTRPLDFLKKVYDITPILNAIKDEDPQTIAVVLAYMKPTQGAELLQQLPEEKMIDVIVGIAKMDVPNREVLQRLEELLSRKLNGLMGEEQSQPDGVKSVVQILSSVNRSTEKTVFDQLEMKDPLLAKTIHDKMFVFDDLIGLENIYMQKIFARITEPNVIAKALKTANEELKEKIMSALPEKRREIVLDALDVLGKIKLSEAEEAQQQITTIAKQLESDGDIIIARGENDVIV